MSVQKQTVKSRLFERFCELYFQYSDRHCMHFGFSDFDRYFDAGGDPVGRSWNGILARSPVLRDEQGNNISSICFLVSRFVSRLALTIQVSLQFHIENLYMIFVGRIDGCVHIVKSVIRKVCLLRRNFSAVLTLSL